MPSASHDRKTRTSRRTRQRGAALVEAALVLPVICTFLGFMIWFHSIYQTKQEVSLRARAQAFTYASHACNGAAPPADGSANGSIKGRTATNASNVGPGKSSMSTRFNTTHATADGTARGKGGTTGGWERQIRYEAAVMCNEREAPSGLAGMASFAVGVVRSGNPF